MTIAARIVGVTLKPAMIAFLHMSAQISGAAAQNIVNHIIVLLAHVVSLPIIPDMPAKDVGQLQFGLIHGHPPPRGIWGFQQNDQNQGGI